MCNCFTNHLPIIPFCSRLETLLSLRQDSLGILHFTLERPLTVVQLQQQDRQKRRFLLTRYENSSAVWGKTIEIQKGELSQKKLWAGNLTWKLWQQFPSCPLSLQFLFKFLCNTLCGNAYHKAREWQQHFGCWAVSCSRSFLCYVFQKFPFSDMVCFWLYYGKIICK